MESESKSSRNIIFSLPYPKQSNDMGILAKEPDNDPRISPIRQHKDPVSFWGSF